MVKRAFKNHRLAISLVAINSVIVVEEFAHVYLYPPPNHWAGLGWYWTAVLSLPSSILWYLVSERFSSDFLCMLCLLLIGGFQWGVIGTLLDRSRRRHSSAET
jgi:hypothetical protein